MSYGRDRDAATRHPGAIAASDKANPRAASMRRARRAHATRVRDQALAHLTMGPKGGIALGAISRGGAGILQSIMSPQIKSGGVIEGGPSAANLPPMRPPPPPLVGPKPKSPFDRVPVGLRAITGLQPAGGRLVPGRGGKLPSFTAQPSSNPSLTPASELDPSSISLPPKRVGVPANTGGGGGGGGGSSAPISSPADLPDMSIDPLPDVTATPATASGVSTKTLAIVGGLGIAAYLLLRKKRG